MYNGFYLDVESEHHTESEHYTTPQNMISIMQYVQYELKYKYGPNSGFKYIIKVVKLFAHFW